MAQRRVFRRQRPKGQQPHSDGIAVLANVQRGHVAQPQPNDLRGRPVQKRELPKIRVLRTRSPTSAPLHTLRSQHRSPCRDQRRDVLTTRQLDSELTNKVPDSFISGKKTLRQMRSAAVGVIDSPAGLLELTARPVCWRCRRCWRQLSDDTGVSPPDATPSRSGRPCADLLQ